MYSIEFSEDALIDLKRVRASKRAQILDGIEKQLSYEPTTRTRSRKLLHSLVPEFEAVPPIWQLRVGEYRVFYDVNEESRIVFVRAIRRKPSGKRTEEIL